MEYSIRAFVGHEAGWTAKILGGLAITVLVAASSRPVQAAERVVLCEEFTNRM